MHIFSTPRPQLESHLQAMGLSPVHGKALFQNAYRHLNSMPWLGPIPTSRGMEEAFAGWETTLPHFQVPLHSLDDHSLKFGVTLHDGLVVESVLMPEKTRLTLCVSTQAGCRQACAFCHTGRMGFTRNLSAAEIVGQVVEANRWIRDNPDWVAQTGLPAEQSVSNLVFMGMGEPLDNLEALQPALEILLDPMGWGFAPRKVTVSTAGHLDGLRALLSWNLGVSVALSLHAVDPALRRKIMPIELRYPVVEVLAFLRQQMTEKKLKTFLVQYTVMAGVNDTEESAHQLVQLLAPFSPKVNLIPFNPFSGSAFRAPTHERLFSFKGILQKASLATSIRFSKGKDIHAACGQLHR